VAPSACLPHNHPGYAYALDGLTEQRPGWTPNNALLGQLRSLGYSHSQQTVNPVTGATRYKFPYSSARLSLRAAACGEAALAGSSYADATACGRLHQPSQATSRGDC
jgi:hypothetical protein